jgi:Flp pilus assembly protein TadG
VVEFALIAVLLLLLVFGIAQFGLALNTTNDATQLASEGARYAAVNYLPGGTSLQAWVKSQADTGLLSSGGKVCVSFPPLPDGSANPGQVGDPVRVTVTTNFAWQPLNGLSRLTRGAVPASTPLTGSATMRLEAPPSNYSAGCTP